MTTYYGVWSGEEWYYVGREIFHTLSLGLARAQAVMVSGWLTPATWEARAIGEDGLPVNEPTRPRITVEFAPRPEPYCWTRADIKELAQAFREAGL